MSEVKWEASGRYFESCNCDVGCPCAFLAPPTEGHCDVAVAWHIDQGTYGQTLLNNLNVVCIFSTPGNMIEGNWKAALYIDEKALPEQREALVNIFSGQSGGAFALFKGLISEFLGIKYVPIEFSKEDGRHRVKIPTVLEVEIGAIEGAEKGKPVQIINLPLSITPGHPVTVGRSTVNKFQDYALYWEFSNKNGFFSDFKYIGP